MKTAEVLGIINMRLDRIIVLADTVMKSFDPEAVYSFKTDMKALRNFMSFVRLQRNDRAMKFPEKCKYLYHIAGSLAELNERDLPAEEKRKLTEKAQDEWKKIYNPAHLLKLKKMLNEYDYSRIHPELFNNFFSGHAMPRD